MKGGGDSMKFPKMTGYILSMILSLLPLPAGAESLGNARLSFIDGDVQIKPEDSPEWIPVSINMPLRGGDRIWVPGKGRAEVQLAGGPQVRLDERSFLDILNLERDSAQLYLSAGRAYVNFSPDRSRFVQFDTPVSSVRAYDRAVFNVDVTNGETDISVYNGMVTVDSREGRTSIYSGSMISLGGDYADLVSLGRPDEWERWNMDRDRRYEDRKFASARYLPDELDIYASDFDDYGRWVTTREYGYVWTPTVSISVGWTPYRHGRWCWIAGDYVWVGYEPWGWAPYHYGRWAFAAPVGWFWVPPARGAVYWGPGYVGWVSTPTYVAWVPLAPEETYYGRGYYGSHSVNIVNVNVNKVVVNKIYKNVYVNNSVTTVHRDTFVKGRSVDFRPRENPFLREKAHIGSPDIRPERATRMPVIKEISRGKEPPHKIREVNIRELQQRRRFVRDRNEPVFTSDRPARELNVRTSDAPSEHKRDRTVQGRKEHDVRPADRQLFEEKEWKAVPPEKQRAEDRTPQKRGSIDMRQEEKEPAVKLHDRPSQTRTKSHSGNQDGRQTEKIRGVRGRDSVKELPAAEKQLQRQRQLQPEQPEQQRQAEERKPARPIVPDERSLDRRRVKETDRERQSVHEEKMKREEPRRQRPAVEAAPQQQQRDDRGNRYREPNETLKSGEDVPQISDEQRGRGKGR